MNVHFVDDNRETADHMQRLALYISSDGTASGCEKGNPARDDRVRVAERRSGSLKIMCEGHLYTRSAETFDKGQSLEELLDTLEESNIEQLKCEIGGGIYAVVIIDEQRRQLYAFCDPLACMPFFYHVNSSACRLSTNQFDVSTMTQPDKDACAEYLSYGYLPFSPSLFKGVQRLGPGQVLTLNLDRPGNVTVTEESLPRYPRLEDRITDIDEACERLDNAFTRYFSRLRHERLALGLSGGYDSRLIAAYTAGMNCRLATFGNPGTTETETAENVASALGTSTELFEIPADSPSRFLDDFRYGMQTLDSLESSHVFGNLHSLNLDDPDFILDGFLGGEVMGSHYFYQLNGGIEPLWKILLVRDRYHQPVQPSAEYAAKLAGAYGRYIPLTHDMSIRAGVEKRASEQLIRMAEEQRPCCACHADMLELLSYRIRTRCLIAGGPVTFLRKASVLCPFYDADVFATCVSMDKSLRAGDRVYNAFFRHRFPEFAHIPKESTGGRASQRDVMYRLTHFCTALNRRVLPRAARAGGDTNNFVAAYRQCRTNTGRREMYQMEHTQRLPQSIMEIMNNSADAVTQDSNLWLRSVSLAQAILEYDSRPTDSSRSAHDANYKAI